MGFLTNGLVVLLMFIFSIISLFAAIYFLVNESKSGIVICFISFLFFGIVWFYGATHEIVPLNTRVMIINTSTGQIEGTTRLSGVTDKPFLFNQVNYYPGATQQPFCMDYTPALQEGYEIATRICGVYDASNVDWVLQFKEHNFTNEQQMISFWQDQTKEIISNALVGVNYTKIVTDRASVSKSIRDNLTPWFTEINVNVSNLQLSNWDFTNADVKASVNQASAASMKSTVEKQLLEASKIARERQLYETETSNLVLAERGKGLQLLFQSLNINDDSSKAYLASQMTWYTFAQNPPAGTQIILGIGGSPIAAPFNVTPQTISKP